VVIGLILAVTAWLLAVETKDLLIGEAADPAVVQAVRNLAARRQGVEAVHRVLTLHMGPEHVVANLSLDFRDDLAAADVERITGELAADIKTSQPLVRQVFIEARDPRPAPTPEGGA
jgi:divalent metal cation (Fe/Co/Zn/Cd) transporter